MNGRIYEPTIGRFLSADPIVHNPSSSQSYNRYSYVFNSPLSFTDLSGYDPDPEEEDKKKPKDKPNPPPEREEKEHKGQGMSLRNSANVTVMSFGMSGSGGVDATEGVEANGMPSLTVTVTRTIYWSLNYIETVVWSPSSIFSGGIIVITGNRPTPRSTISKQYFLKRLQRSALSRARGATYGVFTLTGTIVGYAACTAATAGACGALGATIFYVGVAASIDQISIALTDHSLIFETFQSAGVNKEIANNLTTGIHVASAFSRSGWMVPIKGLVGGGTIYKALDYSSRVYDISEASGLGGP